jgi:hypothetical protein
VINAKSVAIRLSKPWFALHEKTNFGTNCLSGELIAGEKEENVMKLAIAAALAGAIAVPAFAQSTVTEYYVVQDTTTKLARSSTRSRQPRPSFR